MGRVLRSGQDELLHVSVEPAGTEGLDTMIPHPRLHDEGVDLRPADDWLLVLGDVCGQAVEAAVLTGRARQSIRMAALMFTDGVEEARGSDGCYGMDRLLGLLPDYAGAGPVALCEAVERSGRAPRRSRARRHRPARGVLRGVIRVAEGLSGAVTEFDRALSAVDGRAAMSLVRRLLGDGADPLSILVDVIAAGRRRVGERWQRGEWSIATLHHFPTAPGPVVRHWVEGLVLQGESTS